ncbi:MAG: RsmD family RNA methyltransferase, partial [Clostridia bacterium]|nr:RsmD family RNA methyltransferase [Clostridia bacterium]
MRVITGTARGTKLAALEGEVTRPTTDKVKEAVFSMIQFDIEGRAILDLFAGSGQLALEARSRGAARATMIYQS